MTLIEFLIKAKTSTYANGINIKFHQLDLILLIIIMKKIVLFIMTLILVVKNFMGKKLYILIIHLYGIWNIKVECKTTKLLMFMIKY